MWGTVESEVKVPSFENPELAMVLSFKTGVGQNRTLLVTARHTYPLKGPLFLRGILLVD